MGGGLLLFAPLPNPLPRRGEGILSSGELMPIKHQFTVCVSGLSKTLIILCLRVGFTATPAWAEVLWKCLLESCCPRRRQLDPVLRKDWI